MSLTFYFLLLFSYAVGSIPFGLLIGRLFADVDVRSMGSGNIGATNVNRVLGRKLGAATLLCDMLKGLLCVLLAFVLLKDDKIQMAWVGFAAFIGHCFPIYLRFRGGKGVATAFGVLLPISPYAGLIALWIWLVVVRISKISALGALISSVSIPVMVFFFEKKIELAGIFLLMVAIVIWRHKDNIRRMKTGREHGL